ncbi:MAG: LPS export ABC transporter periplasmic protein LptC [Proteobacteria bacterium]|nr:LPS export ABC transporter periplasmic protein LptC [Pseudomonadota bacterium]
MKRKVKAVSGLFIVVCVLSLAVLVGLHYMNSKGLEVVVAEDRSVGVKMSGIHYSSTRDGKVEWVLDAKSATAFKRGERTLFDSVKLVFYASDATTYKLTAKEGTVDEKLGTVEVAGDVHVESLDGTYSLKTEILNYSSEMKRFETDLPVEILASGMDVTGTGLMIDIDRGWLKVESDVRAVLSDGAL